MPKWIQPIYDRTEADVDAAKAYNNAFTGNADVALKGALNASDLNRIESNCKYLAELLRTHGYTVEISVKTDWTMYDFPTSAEFTRLRNNITKLMEVYHQAVDMPDLRSDNWTDYIEINAMEFDLHRINQSIDLMHQITTPSNVYNSAAVGYLHKDEYDVKLCDADGVPLAENLGWMLYVKEE